MHCKIYDNILHAVVHAILTEIKKLHMWNREFRAFPSHDVDHNYMYVIDTNVGATWVESVFNC